MAPRYVAKLFEHQEKVRRRSEFTLEAMLGQLIAMVGNTSFRAFDPPLQPKAFMPSQWKEPNLQKPKRRTKQQIAAELKSVLRSANQ